MSLKTIKEQQEKSLLWKNIKPLRESLANLPIIKDVRLEFENAIKISSEKITNEQKMQILTLAKALKPWRKGPFEVFDIFIDTEWQSFIKFNILSSHFRLDGKTIADIGCNNGYYMFKMLEFSPKEITGFDPSPLCKTQFDFINHFLKTDIKFELLGIEHLEFYEQKFDIIFCLGVLYHRSDPVLALKQLYNALNDDGELFLDTLILQEDRQIALIPDKTYAKMSNVYFIPTLKTLEIWCKRAKFSEFEVLDIKKTDINEQRKTEWILGESLGDFLDKNNPNLTIEGYNAPTRAYIKLKKN